MIAPEITLGGTDPDSLLDSFRAARVALRIAMDSIRRCEPHPRDFPEDYEAAFIEHKDRLAAVQTVIDQYTMLAAEVICQQDQQQREAVEQ